MVLYCGLTASVCLNLHYTRSFSRPYALGFGLKLCRVGEAFCSPSLCLPLSLFLSLSLSLSLSFSLSLSLFLFLCFSLAFDGSLLWLDRFRVFESSFHAVFLPAVCSGFGLLLCRVGKAFFSVAPLSAYLSLSLTLSLSLPIGAGVAARDPALFLFCPVFFFGTAKFFFILLFSLIGRLFLVSGVSC